MTSKAIRRIAKEYKTIQETTDLSLGIDYQEHDLLTARAIIVGPPGTPYEFGFFQFSVQFPRDYPESPPEIRALTNNSGQTRFNPNIYASGKVCLSILGTWMGDRGEEWSSVHSLESVLISIQSLLSENPYKNEPGFDNTPTHRDTINMMHYNAKIKHETLRLAVVQPMEKYLQITSSNEEDWDRHISKLAAASPAFPNAGPSAKFKALPQSALKKIPPSALEKIYKGKQKAVAEPSPTDDFQNLLKANIKKLEENHKKWERTRNEREELKNDVKKQQTDWAEKILKELDENDKGLGDFETPWYTGYDQPVAESSSMAASQTFKHIAPMSPMTAGTKNATHTAAQAWRASAAEAWKASAAGNFSLAASQNFDYIPPMSLMTAGTKFPTHVSAEAFQTSAGPSWKTSHPPILKESGLPSAQKGAFPYSSQPASSTSKQAGSSRFMKFFPSDMETAEPSILKEATASNLKRTGSPLANEFGSPKSKKAASPLYKDFMNPSSGLEPAGSSFLKQVEFSSLKLGHNPNLKHFASFTSRAADPPLFKDYKSPYLESAVPPAPRIPAIPTVKTATKPQIYKTASGTIPPKPIPPIFTKSVAPNFKKTPAPIFTKATPISEKSAQNCSTVTNLSIPKSPFPILEKPVAAQHQKAPVPLFTEAAPTSKKRGQKYKTAGSSAFPKSHLPVPEGSAAPQYQKAAEPMFKELAPIFAKPAPAFKKPSHPEWGPTTVGSSRIVGMKAIASREPFQEFCKRRFLWYFDSYLNAIDEEAKKRWDGLKFESMPFELLGNKMNGRFQYTGLRRRLLAIRQALDEETHRWAEEGLLCMKEERPAGVQMIETFKQVRTKFEDLYPSNLKINLADKDNPFVWVIMYAGRPYTRLDGGVFRIRFTISPKFPDQWPRAVFETKLFHHRVSPDGVLCYVPDESDELASHVEAIIDAIEKKDPPYDPRTIVNVEASKLFWGSEDQKREYRRRLRASILEIAELNAARIREEHEARRERQAREREAREQEAQEQEAQEQEAQEQEECDARRDRKKQKAKAKHGTSDVGSSGSECQDSTKGHSEQDNAEGDSEGNSATVDVKQGSAVADAEGNSVQTNAEQGQEPCRSHETTEALQDQET